MEQKRIRLISSAGKQQLGSILKASREAQDWSMEELVDRIEEISGHKLGRSTISSLERGHNLPSWDTLALIEAAEYVVWPGTDRLMTIAEMFEIATEPMGGDSAKGKSANELGLSSRFSRCAVNQFAVA